MAEQIDYSQIAGLYDVYVRSTLDIPFYIQEASQVTGRVLELMCGTGRVSIPLLEEGARLTCVDRSPEMLARLREKLDTAGLSAEVYQIDVCQLNLPALYELVLLPFHSFSELLNSRDQRQLLDAVYRHLVRDGRFICPLHNRPVRMKRVDGQYRLWGRHALIDRPGTLLMWGVEEWDATSDQVRGMQIFELYDDHNIMRSKRYQETRFTLPDRTEFEELARSAGFKIEALWGDYSYAPFDEQTSPYMIWILRR